MLIKMSDAPTERLKNGFALQRATHNKKEKG
jgi:hypothetical protein